MATAPHFNFLYPDINRPGKQFVIVCSKPEDFVVDDDKYVLKFCNDVSEPVRIKVSKCSTVFFTAVNVHVSTLNIPHCGLVIENDFEVTINGSTTTYKGGCLILHAVYKKSESSLGLSTQIFVCMCSTKAAAVNELATCINNNADYYTADTSPGFVSYTSSCELVRVLQAEIVKPFDTYWRRRLEKSEKAEIPKLGDNETNCAVFAGRIFYTLLPPSEDKNDIATARTFEVFQRLGFEESKVTPCLSAITE